MIIDDVLKRLPQCESKFEMERLTTYAEIELAIKQINNTERTPRLVVVSLELLKVKKLSVLYLSSFSNDWVDLFVAVSHQTGLDTRSMTQRPIIVGI